MIVVVASEKEEVRNRMSTVLEGYEVVECDNFLDVIGAVSLAKDECKIVLADYDLKPFNGIALLESVKKMRTGIRTILLIDKSDEEAEIEGLFKREIDLVLEYEKPDTVIRVYVERLLERSKQLGPTYIRGNELIIEGCSVALTRKEIEILSVLIKNKGEAMSREEISSKIWLGVEKVRKIDFHINSIRAKLAENGLFNYIVTVPKVGYRWRSDE